MLLATCVGLLQVLYQHVHFASRSDLSLPFWIVATVAALLGFLWYQLRHDRPLINMRALARRTFLVGIVLYFGFYFTIYAFGYVFSVFVETLRLEPNAVGFVQIVQTLTSLIAQQEKAVTLAQREQGQGSNRTALEFAKQVIESRTAEIAELRAYGG